MSWRVNLGAIDGPEELEEQCVILKPLAAPSWKQIRGVSFIGFYAMPGLTTEAYRTEYLKRVDKAAYSLLEFVQKDVAGDALLKWETVERTMKEMVEMGATDDIDSTWAVIVGVNIDVLNDPSGEVSESFGNAWIPLFSSVMQFHVPFKEAPNFQFLEGDQDCALILYRLHSSRRRRVDEKPRKVPRP